MAENLLNSAINKTDKETPPQSARPAQVPEKFWDGAANSMRVEELLKSYLELEKKLSSGDHTKSQPSAEQLRKMLGVPETCDGYSIKCDHGLFEPASDINKRMHDLNFSPAQAQFVYDLAAERMIPMISDLAAHFEAEKEVAKLQEKFGGVDGWSNMAKQLFAWGRRNLPAHAVEGLSRSYDGVMAMYEMMKNGIEPSVANTKGKADADEDPQKMISDPRYWRDRNPEFVAKVTEAYRRKYDTDATDE